VILALLIRFSTQYLHNRSDTYQTRGHQWSIGTNLIDFGDDSDENLLAFGEYIGELLTCSHFNFLLKKRQHNSVPL
jgi:hypothetical protein